MTELFLFYFFCIIIFAVPGAVFLGSISAVNLIAGTSISFSFFIIAAHLISLMKIKITYYICLVILALLYACALIYNKKYKKSISFERSSIILIIPFLFSFSKYYFSRSAISLDGMDMIVHCMKTAVMIENHSTLPDIMKFITVGNYFYPNGSHTLLLVFKIISKFEIHMIFLYFFYLLYSLIPALIYILCQKMNFSFRSSAIALMISLCSYSMMLAFWKFALLPAFLSLFMFLCFIMIENESAVIKTLVFCGLLTIHPHIPIILIVSFIIYSAVYKKLNTKDFLIIIISTLFLIFIYYHQIHEFIAISQFSTLIENSGPAYYEIFKNPSGINSLFTLFISYFMLDIIFFMLIIYGYFHLDSFHNILLKKFFILLGILSLFSIILNFLGILQTSSLTWRMLILFDAFNPLILAFSIDKISFANIFKKKIIAVIIGICSLAHFFMITVMVDLSIRNMNEQCSFNENDMKAYKWIKENTSENDVFLGSFGASNGAQWISYFTKRKVIHMWVKKSYFKIWKTLIKKAKNNDMKYLKMSGISYIYLTNRKYVQTEFYFSKDDISVIRKTNNIVYENKDVSIIKL